MRWLTESAMHRRRSMISADWKKKRGDSIGAAPVRPQISERRKARQGYGLHLTRYGDRGWRATFYMTGMEHSPTSATGTAWERTPWHATQRAVWEALVTTAKASARGRTRRRTAPSTLRPAASGRTARIPFVSSVGDLRRFDSGRRGTDRSVRHEDLADLRVGVEQAHGRDPQVLRFRDLADALRVERVERGLDRDHCEDVDLVFGLDQRRAEHPGGCRDPVDAGVHRRRQNSSRVPLERRIVETIDVHPAVERPRLTRREPRDQIA